VVITIRCGLGSCFAGYVGLPDLAHPDVRLVGQRFVVRLLVTSDSALSPSAIICVAGDSMLSCGAEFSDDGSMVGVRRLPVQFSSCSANHDALSTISSRGVTPVWPTRRLP